MRGFTIYSPHWLWLTVLATRAVFGSGDVIQPKQGIDLWVEQLGSADFDARTLAEANLTKAGEPALEKLAQAKDSPDAEVRMRSARVRVRILAASIFKRLNATLASPAEAEFEIKQDEDGRQWTSICSYKANGDGKKFMLDMQTTFDGEDWTKHNVCDGQTVWSETNVKRDGKIADRYVEKCSLPDNLRAGPLRSVMLSIQGGPLAGNLFQALNEFFALYSFDSVSEGKLDGADVWVLTGTVVSNPPPPLNDQVMKFFEKVRISIGKQDSTMRQVETSNADSSHVRILHVSKFETGVTLEDKTFDYTPPEKVEVRAK